MAELISAFWIFLETLSIFLVCDGFMPRKPGKKGYVFFGICAANLVVNTCRMPKPLAMALTFCCLYAMPCLTHQGNWLRRLSAVTTGYFLLAIQDTILGYGACWILGVSMEEFFQMRFAMVVAISAGKLLTPFTAWLVAQWSRESDRRIRKRWMLLRLLFPAASILMLGAVYSSFRTREDLSVLAVIFSISLAAANVFILYLLDFIEKGVVQKQEIALLNQQMELQTENIISLEKSYRAQRTASHEYAHQLAAIADLLGQGEYEAAKSYVRQLQGIQTTRVFSINSHHPIIDAVLNQKYQTAKEKGIEMQVRVSDLEKLDLPTNAVVVLLSNLLDNAIEGCQRVEGEKCIHFSFLLEEEVFLSVENTSLPVEIREGRIATSKTPASDHGFGLVSIRRILDDLGGEYTYSYCDGWFRFAAELPIE